MRENRVRAAVGVVVLLALVAVFVYRPQELLTLENLKSSRAVFAGYVDANPVLASAVYFLLYVGCTALSIPGASILTLAGGAVFGFLHGLILVSFASTIGATLAFLLARFLFRDAVQRKFGDKLERINRGIEREGAFYLFTLRLVPAFPFFVINVVMGLTPIRPLTYAVVSQIGMLPGTMAYVFAGTELGRVNSLGDVVSPGLLAAFVVLGVLPLVSKWALAFVRTRRTLRRFPRPESFDYNLVVVGGGAAGLVSAYIAAAAKAKVALVERHEMGGDCLNTGCVPSKALIRSAKVADLMQRAEEYGLEKVAPKVDFGAVMDRVARTISAIEPHDSVERYTELGVECIRGEAVLRSPFEVEVDGRVLRTKNIILATGAAPIVPDIPGLSEIRFWTSETIWQLRELPSRLVVLGGGPIGCELAQAFQRLGSQVAIVEMGDRLLQKEDVDVSEHIATRLERDGVQLSLGSRVKQVGRDAGKSWLVCDTPDGETTVPFDEILLAVGRRGTPEKLGLEPLGIRIEKNGTIGCDEYLRTGCPNIFVCGDAAGPYQFTHVASHQAWYASVNALFGPFVQYRADYRVIPWATFTDPEVARVGLNEDEARSKGIDYEVTRYGIDDLDRAIVDGEAQGFVKVLTEKGKDKIVGAVIVGPHASELVSEFVTAMKHGIGLNRILSTIHIYPTLMEANKYAAGQWKRAHVSAGVLGWVERFHRWRRGEKAPQGGAASATH